MMGLSERNITKREPSVGSASSKNALRKPMAGQKYNIMKPWDILEPHVFGALCQCPVLSHLEALAGVAA